MVSRVWDRTCALLSYAKCCVPLTRLRITHLVKVGEQLSVLLKLNAY